ncbi:hypothetical protein C8A00DRAFT_37980 [Chaetomidium leptoderma]|uniref:NmrA-like domain-containing protein n=1 Tax=Chaetomidium leptoderma TaxID=669021 RepID=A0AAN6VDF4_9PEZI|nr:hypothetical protein C8A00DRAFT_37980 [Chaetomidium leptoderma]
MSVPQKTIIVTGATGKQGGAVITSILASPQASSLNIVGDELSQPEADVVFKQVTGRSMPIAPCVIANTVKLVLRDSVGDMFRWFRESGYGGSVEACREMYPPIKDFRAWIEENKGNWAK